MATANSEIPAWMARIKAEDEAVQHRATVEAKDRALINALMKTEEPRELWNRMKQELERLAALSDRWIGYPVTVSDISSPTESGVEVKATTIGIGRIGEFRSVCTNVFFSPDKYLICCQNEFEEHPTHFRFCTIENTLTLCSKQREIKPEQAASEIIERLTSILRTANR